MNLTETRAAIAAASSLETPKLNALLKQRYGKTLGKLATADATAYLAELQMDEPPAPKTPEAPQLQCNCGVSAGIRNNHESQCAAAYFHQQAKLVKKSKAELVKIAGPLAPEMKATTLKKKGNADLVGLILERQGGTPEAPKVEPPTPPAPKPSLADLASGNADALAAASEKQAADDKAAAPAAAAPRSRGGGRTKKLTTDEDVPVFLEFNGATMRGTIHPDARVTLEGVKDDDGTLEEGSSFKFNSPARALHKLGGNGGAAWKLIYYLVGEKKTKTAIDALRPEGKCMGYVYQSDATRRVRSSGTGRKASGLGRRIETKKRQIGLAEGRVAKLKAELVKLEAEKVAAGAGLAQADAKANEDSERGNYHKVLDELAAMDGKQLTEIVERLSGEPVAKKLAARVIQAAIAKGVPTAHVASWKKAREAAAATA